MAGGRAPCCRAPSCDKNTVTKGPWSPAEDARLTAFIQRYGPGNWRIVPKKAGLWRCGKSCRLRWMNYLSPDIKRGNFTREEEETIINLHNVHGNKWSMIAAELPGRTDNEIKNVFNTHLKKRLKKEDPECHKDDKSKEAPMISSSFHFSSTSSNVSCEDQNVGKGPIRVDAAAMPSQEMNSRFNSKGVNEVHNAVNEEELQGKVSQLPPNFEFDFHDLVKENLESIELPKEQPLKDSCQTHTKQSAECW